MSTFARLCSTILGAMLVLWLPAAPAHAQPINQAWVASNGDDGGPFCHPCRTFQRAHDVVSAGGVIKCVDPGDYGPLTITKAISIVCDSTQAGILVKSTGLGATSSTAITINAGATDIVSLIGLELEAFGGDGFVGILFAGGAALHVNKVKIQNFRNTPGGVNGAGILFQPITYAELYVTDSYITDNGSAGTDDGGILIKPTGTASANAFINRVQLENNAAGIRVNGSNSTGVAVNTIVLESMVVGSAGNGIEALTTGGRAAVSVLVDHTVVSGNFASGINANGAAASGAGSAVVRIGDSTIALNVTGVGTTGAGVVQSFKNNRISGNLTDGTPITAFPGPGGPLQ